MPSVSAQVSVKEPSSSTGGTVAGDRVTWGCTERGLYIASRYTQGYNHNPFISLETHANLIRENHKSQPLATVYTVGPHYRLCTLATVYTVGPHYRLCTLATVYTVGPPYRLCTLATVHTVGPRYRLCTLATVHTVGPRYRLCILATVVHSGTTL